MKWTINKPILILGLTFIGVGICSILYYKNVAEYNEFVESVVMFLVISCMFLVGLVLVIIGLAGKRKKINTIQAEPGYNVNNRIMLITFVVFVILLIYWYYS